MPMFGSAGTSPGVLRQDQIRKLVTPTAGGEEILNSLKKFGLKTSKAVGTVVVMCRYGNSYQGTSYMLFPAGMGGSKAHVGS